MPPAAPVTQQFRLNNTNPALATIVWMSKTSAGGADLHNFLGLLGVGGRIAFQDFNDATKFAAYDLSAATTDGGTYVTVPVTFDKGSGTFNANQRTPCTVVRFSA